MLVVDAVSKAYRGEPVLNGVGLQVPRGSIYALVGPNGAGKTTLLRIITGLVRPSCGSVSYAGQDLSRHRIEVLRKVGSLIENPAFYPHLSGVDNLRYIAGLLNIHAHAVSAALAAVGLVQAAQRKVGEYSLGMKQRLGLAMCLLREPEFLILDEPTNGLDPAGIKDLRNILMQLRARGMTVFMTSHLLQEVEALATHMAVMRSGKIVFSGTSAQLQLASLSRLDIDVASEQVDTARGLLTPAYEVGVQAGRLCIHGVDAEKAADINTLLVGAGLRVSGMRIHRPTLEDLFFSLAA